MVLVHRLGFKPRTYSLEVNCSIQLSYRCKYHIMRLLMLDTSVFTCSKTCWSYPLKKSVLNVVVGGLTDHISTYPFSYSQSGLTRKVVIMEIPTNSMSISYSVVACCGFEPPQWVMSPICNHLHLHAIYYVLPRGIEPRFSG